LHELREQSDKYKEQIAKQENDLIRCQTIIENAKTKINQTYHMTIEYAIENYSIELPVSDDVARQMIAKLQNEINELGSINMEAIDELEEKQERYDQLVAQQKDLEQAKNDILQAIDQLDTKAKEEFKKTIDNVNATLPEVFKYLFGGGSCHLEYTQPDDILSSGIEVFANPPGKNVVHLNLLSGGEKTLVALSILFSILKNKSFPLVILDEAESALDPANVERFGNIIRDNDLNTQFVVITHRPGTMERCEVLYGATMQIKGVTSVFKVSISQAKNEFIEADKQ